MYPSLRVKLRGSWGSLWSKMKVYLLSWMMRMFARSALTRAAPLYYATSAMVSFFLFQVLYDAYLAAQCSKSVQNPLQCFTDTGIGARALARQVHWSQEQSCNCGSSRSLGLPEVLKRERNRTTNEHWEASCMP